MLRLFAATRCAARAAGRRAIGCCRPAALHPGPRGGQRKVNAATKKVMGRDMETPGW